MNRPSVISMADVDLALLAPDPQNTNVMDDAEYEGLKQLIDEAGFLQTILVCKMEPARGKRYRIIDGHYRCRAAEELGMVRVPAIITETEEVARRVLNVGMNRLRGRPDLSLVSEVLRSLIDDGARLEDVRLAGYGDDELEALLRPPDAQNVLDDLSVPPDEGEDEVPIQFVLEVPFARKQDYQRAKRVLKKLAGKAGDLGAALLALID